MIDMGCCAIAGYFLTTLVLEVFLGKILSIPTIINTEAVRDRTQDLPGVPTILTSKPQLPGLNLKIFVISRNLKQKRPDS